MQNKINYFYYWILCIVGACAVIPYARYLEIIPSSMSANWILLLTIIQSAIFYGIILWLSFLIIPKQI